LLAGTMIYLGEKSSSVEEGIEKSKELISNGKAFEKFIEIVEAQSGDVRVVENPESYPEPKFKFEVKANQNGYIFRMNSFEIGMLGIELGAGRMKYTDSIDPKAGFIFYKKGGDEVKTGEVIAEIRTDKDNKEYFIKKFLNSIEIRETKPEQEPLVFKTI
jgi:thymidine phosphorylase